MSTETKQEQVYITLDELLAKKKREQERKGSTFGSQHSTKSYAEKHEKLKKEEVSQQVPAKRDDTDKAVEQVKPAPILVSHKNSHDLNELHQQQVKVLELKKLAPIPLQLDQRLSDDLTYVDVPLVLRRTNAINVDTQLCWTIYIESFYIYSHANPRSPLYKCMSCVYYTHFGVPISCSSSSRSTWYQSVESFLDEGEDLHMPTPWSSSCRLTRSSFFLD